ncbi:hypothetical protein QP166_05110 [Sphingomonas sp. LR60]|uniref:hypothetical protein n=1 Tax=Sphingomonas sp. LR60 TaxID=3050233 RepID=UPI002FE31934
MKWFPYMPSLFPSFPLSLSFYFFYNKFYTFDVNSQRGRHLRLISQAVSDVAIRLLDDLSKKVAARTFKVYKPSKPFMKALGAFVSDLLDIASSDEIDYGYHSVSQKAFTGEEVGQKPFVSVVNGMLALNLIVRVKGFKEHTGPNAKAEATRFWPTAKLLKLAAAYGITPANRGLHFGFMPRPASIPQPVTLKSARTFTRDPQPMPIRPGDTKATAIAAQVNDLNAFFAKQVIEPNKHYGFVRMFANGDRPDFDWDQGGRLYSVGFDNYQQLPGKPREGEPISRAGIRINGETTVELDIKASHLTILHAMMKVPLPGRTDPYGIEGYDRAVIKTFVTMTLGYDRFHKDWTKDAIDTFRKKSVSSYNPDGLALTAFSFNDVKEATLDNLTILKGWKDSHIRWGDLQYLESEVIIATISELAFKYGIAALPVHDSIIVPVSARELAIQVLKQKFEELIGLTPTIEAK